MDFDALLTEATTIYSRKSRDELHTTLRSRLEGSTLEDFEALRAWGLPTEHLVGGYYDDERQAQKHIILAMATELLEGTKGDLPAPLVEAVPAAMSLNMWTSDSTKEVRAAARALCARAPERAVADALGHSDMQDRASSNLSHAMLDLVHDQAALATFVDAMLSGCQSHTINDNVAVLAPHGAHILPAARASWRKDVSTTHGKAILTLLGRVPHADNAPVLVEALGHKSKGVSELARTYLNALGEGARAALEAGTKARKRAVEEFCVARLEALGEAPSEEAPPEAPDPFSALPADTQASMLEHVEEVRNSPSDARDDAFADFVEKKVRKDPLAWFIATLRVFERGYGRHDIQELLIYTLRKMKKHAAADAMWAAYLDALSNATVEDSHTQSRLMKHVREAPEELFAEQMRALLPTRSGPMSAPLMLLRVSRHQQPLGVELLRVGLTHPRKNVRDLTMNRVPTGASFDAGPIVALGSERKKASRLAAAQALGRCHDDALAAQLPALEAWRSKEKTAEVASELTDLITRARAAS